MKTIIQYNNKLIRYQEPTTIKDRLITSLEYWWLALNEKNAPIKELGFNKEGQVQIAAPIEEDSGIWCSQDIEFESIANFEKIEAQEFDKKWDEFVKKCE